MISRSTVCHDLSGLTPIISNFNETQAHSVKFIYALGRATINRFLLVGRGTGSDAFKCVSEGTVTNPHLLHRKVAFDHASICPKQLNTGFDIGPPQLSQPFRRRRRRLRAIV